MTPILEIVKPELGGNAKEDRIDVKSLPLKYYPSKGIHEPALQENFEAFGLFNRVNEILKIGKDPARADFVGKGFDDSYWIFELQIVEANRKVGELKKPIVISSIGEAIGQAVLYSQLCKKKSSSRKVMPVVVTWTLGSGSLEVLDACRSIGVSFIMLQGPVYLPYEKPALSIYYLEEDDPLPFCTDWTAEAQRFHVELCHNGLLKSEFRFATKEEALNQETKLKKLINEGVYVRGTTTKIRDTMENATN
jgi:hypothetical protein